MTSIDPRRALSAAAFYFLLGLIVLVAALYLYNIYRWGNYPDLGFGFRIAAGVGMVGPVNDHGFEAGIRIGDRILELNGKAVRTLADMRAAINRRLGQENTYLVDRQGERLSIRIANLPIGFRGAFAKSGFFFVLGLCYLAIGTLVFLMKPHKAISWIFFVYASTLGLFLAFLYKTSELVPAWLESVHILAFTFTPAGIIHLAFSFPEERGFVGRFPKTQVIPYVISATLFLVIASATTQLTDAPKSLFMAGVAYLVLSIFVFLGFSVEIVWSSKSELARTRARLILVGFALSAVLPVVDFAGTAFFRVYIFPSFNFYLPFFVFFPLAVAYTIVKHDLFDIDTIIKRTYGYVLTSGALAAIYGGFVLLSNLAFGGYQFARSPLFAIVFILAVVFFFNPVRNRVQRFIDRVFYRLEYDYRATVQRISETMRSLLSLDAIGRTIMQTAQGAMFIDTGCVMLQSRDGSKYECLHRAGEPETSRPESVAKPEEKASDDPSGARALGLEELPADEPLVRKIAENRKEVTIYDIEENPAFEGVREACRRTFENLKATLLVPLIYEERLTGLIALGRKKSGKFYRREDINLLSILANQGAVAVENARMVEEVVEKQRMEEELSIARDLQMSMLPTDCPRILGFEIAAASTPAREVGGDFFDFIDMGAKRVGLLVGDVTGKSVSGALVMSASRSVFRMLSEEKLGVGDIMGRANRRIKQDVSSGMFVALLYAVLESEGRVLRMCSAGQTQPVRLAAETGEAALVETQGDNFPLGILDDASYEETLLRLAPGDKVVFYTDGIVEAMSPEGEIFGFERLLEAVQNAGDRGAEALLKEILEQVNAFAGTAAQHDDLTVIVVAVT